MILTCGQVLAACWMNNRHQGRLSETTANDMHDALDVTSSNQTVREHNRSQEDSMTHCAWCSKGVAVYHKGSLSSSCSRYRHPDSSQRAESGHVEGVCASLIPRIPWKCPEQFVRVRRLWGVGAGIMKKGKKKLNYISAILSISPASHESVKKPPVDDSNMLPSPDARPILRSVACLNI